MKCLFPFAVVTLVHVFPGLLLVGADYLDGYGRTSSLLRRGNDTKDRRTNESPPGRLPNLYASVVLGTGPGGCSGTQEAVLDVYRGSGGDDDTTTNTTTLLSTVLHLIGGAYMNLVPTTIETAGADYVDAGYTVAVLYYRLPRSSTTNNWLVCSNPWEALADVAAAMNVLHDRAEEYRVDTNRIVVSGFSAGGHLAALYGTTCNGSDHNNIIDYHHCPSAMVLHFPFLETGAKIFCTEVGRAFANQENYASCFPTALVSNNTKTPPTILYHASGDPIVPTEQMTDFVRSLADHGVPHEFYQLSSGGGHYLVPYAQLLEEVNGGALLEGTTRDTYAGLIERAERLSSSTSVCVFCDDTPSGWMANHDKLCRKDEWSVLNRCDQDPAWIEAGYCRTSCFAADRGYDGDNCCVEEEEQEAGEDDTPSCTECSDEATPYMLENDQTCASATYAIQTNCMDNIWWTNTKFCQTSCQAAGRGYPGLNCCE